MAALTLQTIRTQVRNTLELDATDLPDALLDLFVQEGFDRIANDHNRWTFYEQDFTFPTVVSQGSYLLSAIDPQLSTVDGVEHPSWMLLPISHQLAQGQYAGSTVSGTPTNFSVWANRLWLWPAPSAVVTMKVRGFRKPTDWVALGASGVPDLPNEFHPLLVLWALHRTYMQQDDGQMGQMLRNMFNEQYKVLRTSYVRQLVAEPSVVGLTNGRTFNMLPPRLRFPFDF